MIVLDTNVISEALSRSLSTAVMEWLQHQDPLFFADALIAGVRVTHECVLATRNVRDFADTPVSLVNPWDS